MVLAAFLFQACSGDDGAGPHASPDSAPHAGDDTSDPGPTSNGIVLGKTPRNLLVVSLDTARRDRLSFFDDRDLTPNLAAVFADGVVLEDHRTCSNWTGPSIYCAQTGNFQLDSDVWPTALHWSDGDPLVTWPPAKNETLATLLGGAGFATTLVTANAMFSLDLEGGAYGFDREVRWIWAVAPDVVDMAIENAAALGADGKPWYYHVHFIDPHEQYHPPPSFWPDPDMECPWDMTSSEVCKQLSGGALWDGLEDDEKDLARACLFNVYEGELRYWDSEMARFWSYFDKAGLLDDTLVVFWTDHGQAFGEHEDKFNHAITLRDPETRSVAAFWARDIEPLRWTGPTLHQDLAPTILRALDVPLGKHTGLVLGDAPDDRMRVGFGYFVANGPPLISVVQSDLKLLYTWDGTIDFYDLAVDPDELVDQYDAKDPDVQRLWEVLEPRIERIDKVWPGLKRVPPTP